MWVRTVSIVFDPLAAADLLEDVANLGAAVRRNNEVDVPAHGFDRNEPEQALGGAVPAGDDAVERFGDDGVVGGFHDRAEKTFALGVEAALGSRLAAQLFEQPGQLALQGDIVDQEHCEDETGRTKSVDPAGVKAQIEPGRVENSGQRDVVHPGAHHDHQPDVEHGMRSPVPQDQQRREAEKHFR